MVVKRRRRMMRKLFILSRLLAVAFSAQTNIRVAFFSHSHSEVKQ